MVGQSEFCSQSITEYRHLFFSAWSAAGVHAVRMSSRLSHDLDLTVSVEYVGIFSVAIGLHIFKSGGDKTLIINSGGDMSPPSPP